MLLVDGESYRIGQIGAFLRLPLGYSSLFGVCTEVGAHAEADGPSHLDTELAGEESEFEVTGYRWLRMTMFGEVVGGRFERGVSQYPTVGDEVHLVTQTDLGRIYGGQYADGLEVGRISASSGISALVDLSPLVSRHSAVVGSTGSGKSNFVAIVIEELMSGRYPSARLLVVDPHAEYSSVVAGHGIVFRTGVTPAVGDGQRLRVPYWALPLDELLNITLGELQPHVLEGIRDRVRDMKVDASRYLNSPPPVEAITADSPVPFSIRKLWFELEDDERVTFSDSNNQIDATRKPPDEPGDAATLSPPRYPPPTSVNTPPYPNRRRRNIGKQLDLMRTRLQDARFAFMFDPTDDLHPDLDGRIRHDLPQLLRLWIGGLHQVTILDVSAVPSEVVDVVVGTLVTIVYDALLWASDMPIGGRAQPLLIVLDEAHRFLPSKGTGPAHRVFTRIAKEGRKYGVGLMMVSQRPSDLDASILSQCGTLVAFRVTNATDRSSVAASVPDDLGGLIELLPALRTGECLLLGEALPIPSRVRIRPATNKPIGDNPSLPAAWMREREEDDVQYDRAVENWRAQRTQLAGVAAAPDVAAEPTNDERASDA